MKPILYLVALLAAAAGAYFSWDLSKKFEVQQTTRIAANDDNTKLDGQVKDTNTNLAAEKTKLKKASDDQTATELAINTAKSAASGFQHDIATLDGTLEEQKAQLAQLNSAIETVKETLKGLGGDVTLENIGDKVKELTNKKLELEKKKEELTANIEGATKVRDGKKTESARLVENKGQRDKRISHNSMESTITAVNQEWGFVMVGAGSNTGFTPQTKLLVERDGHLIGKLQPTSIEPNQTLANIDFDSLAEGVRLQPGDRVLLSEPATN